MYPEELYGIGLFAAIIIGLWIWVLVDRRRHG